MTDDDTGTGSATETVTVNNVAPSITTLFTGAEECGGAHEDEAVTLDVAFDDIGTLDEHSIQIDWGDGTTESLVLPIGQRDLSIDHDYATGGIYEIVVALSDDDLGADTSSVLAVVSGVGLHEGVLQIIGTSEDDHVSINQTGNGTLKVHADFLVDGKRDFVLAEIDRILMVLCEGDDHASISNKVTLHSIIDGGAGDDHLNGGGGSNLIRGGAGDDHLNGGSGRDILVGGLGTDRIIGNGGIDLLSGGTLRASDTLIPGTIAGEAELVSVQDKLIASETEAFENWADDVDNFFSDLSLSSGDDEGDSDRLTGSSGEDLVVLYGGDVNSGRNSKKK